MLGHRLFPLCKWYINVHFFYTLQFSWPFSTYQKSICRIYRIPVKHFKLLWKVVLWKLQIKIYLLFSSTFPYHHSSETDTKQPCQRIILTKLTPNNSVSALYLQNWHQTTLSAHYTYKTDTKQLCQRIILTKLTPNNSVSALYLQNWHQTTLSAHYTYKTDTKQLLSAHYTYKTDTKQLCQRIILTKLDTKQLCQRIILTKLTPNNSVSALYLQNWHQTTLSAHYTYKTDSGQLFILSTLFFLKMKLNDSAMSAYYTSETEYRQLNISSVLYFRNWQLNISETSTFLAHYTSEMTANNSTFRAHYSVKLFSNLIWYAKQRNLLS